MKIRLPFHYQLKINNNYKPVKTVLPIGCDCHPAYMLSKLKLRKESLPFDWMDTKSHLALNFAYETIQSRFQFFLSDLKKNEEGKVASNRHPEALFYHFDDLIENQKLQHKIEKRIQKFLKLYSEKPCYFVHTISSQALEHKENVDFSIEAVRKFTSLLKPNDDLLIYLRFDESEEENEGHVKLFKDEVASFAQVQLVAYVREKNKFGIWGDETKYRPLIHSLGLRTKIGFPKIVLSKKK